MTSLVGRCSTKKSRTISVTLSGDGWLGLQWWPKKDQRLEKEIPGRHITLMSSLSLALFLNSVFWALKLPGNAQWLWYDCVKVSLTLLSFCFDTGNGLHTKSYMNTANKVAIEFCTMMMACMAEIIEEGGTSYPRFPQSHYKVIINYSWITYLSDFPIYFVWLIKSHKPAGNVTQCQVQSCSHWDPKCTSELCQSPPAAHRANPSEPTVKDAL